MIGLREGAVPASSAIDSVAFRSPLGAPHGARHRER